jgi:asparagine synthase (glutamine-hydrolysing)
MAYYTGEHFVSFSGDVTALCRTFHENGFDTEALLGIFKFVDPLLTVNPKVKRVVPGHWARFQNNTLSITRFWKPEQIRIDLSLTQDRVLSDLNTLVANSVSIRSDKRYKAGAHVSSGLDSSFVAAMARREYATQNEFYGYSWSPLNFSSENLPYDERELVREVCTKANLIPVFVSIEIQDAVSVLKNTINNMGYLPEERTLTLVKQHSTNLIFSGWGGDEFISKANAGVDSDLLFGGEWLSFLKKNPLTKPRKFYRAVLFNVIGPAIGYLTFPTRRAFAESTRYLKKQYKKNNREGLRSCYFYRSRRDVHLSYIFSYHIAERTEIWSVNGYKNGVEYRYPLIDKRIIEYMLKVPSKVMIDKSSHTRVIMRKLSENILPESVAWKESKDDPVYHALIENQTIDRASLFLDEWDEFKQNQHLHFFDFEILEKDLAKYKANPAYRRAARLFDTIYNVKWFHEFTKSYFDN